MTDVIPFQPAHLVIPDMTDPLGRVWSQPKTTDFLVSDEFARMKIEDVEKLSDYSHSRPSAVYDGKMWKSFYGEFWYLHWFGPSTKGPGYCSVNTRKISIWL